MLVGAVSLHVWLNLVACQRHAQKVKTVPQPVGRQADTARGMSEMCTVDVAGNGASAQGLQCGDARSEFDSDLFSPSVSGKWLMADYNYAHAAFAHWWTDTWLRSLHSM